MSCMHCNQSFPPPNYNVPWGQPIYIPNPEVAQKVEKLINKMVKDEKKKDSDKKKKAKGLNPQFSLLNTMSLLVLLSYPMYIGMEFTRVYLNNILNGLH